MGTFFYSMEKMVNIWPVLQCVLVICKRQLIRLNMKKKWPTRTGMEDSRPIFFCKRFPDNENAL